ncbi:hypothetical protein [Pseudomonas aeruginosa]|uniref:hypothetical protein n=1 Tax=Pseudomonas aeruginosa TaxID=287 RepID=UPI0015C5ED58|nr:hypothetical protein [Pseudomonas aeruginosa]
MNKALDLLRGLVSEVERKTCGHEETHRGGAIWEICDSCGAKWADDEGGKPEFAWPESVEKARAFLATHPAVEQACWDERKLSDLGNELHNLSCSIVHENEKLAEQIGGIARELWNWPQARAALAQPSQAPDYFAHADKKLEALLNATALILESPGHDAAHYWAKCLREYDEAHAQVAQARHVPELDPLNLAPHAEAFNEAPAEALKPEQAEAERPEVVGYRSGTSGGIYADGYGLEKPEPLMTVAQHERIVEARWNRAMDLMGEHVARISEKFKAERDAAQARVAELTATRNRYGLDAHYFNKNLQRILRDFESFTPDELARSLIILAKVADEKVVAQAQHSVPEGWMLVECGIWTQEQVDEMQKTVARFRNSEFVDDRALAMAVADAGQCKAPEISLAELLAAAPGKEGL